LRYLRAAKKTLDSRGNPTVEVEVILRLMARKVARWCPRARFDRSHEALELRDRDKKRYAARAP